MKEENVQKRVSDIILEKPIVVWFGCIPFIVSPVTYGQLAEVAATANEMLGIETKKIEHLNEFAAALYYGTDARKRNDIGVILLFRSRWARKLFGGFVGKRMTAGRYKKLQDYMVKMTDAGFFLSTIIFLKGISGMTTPTNTPEATAHGEQWEEL